MDPLAKLITISQLIQKARAAGFDFGSGNPVNLIHHYSRQNLIPHAIRIKPTGVVGHTVGCYPESTVGRLLEIQNQRLTGEPVKQEIPLISRPDTTPVTTEPVLTVVAPPTLKPLSQRRKWVFVTALASLVFLLSVMGTMAIFGRKAVNLPEVKLSSDGKVLAAETVGSHLEINSDAVFNGAVNLPSTNNSFTIGTDATTNSLTVTGTVILDQNLSKASSPTFANLTLTGRELVFTDNTQTLTNKTLSGSSNTFSSIPNGALSNSKVTVTAGTNLSGGGDVSLGSSVTLNLKGDISLTSATISGNLGVVGLATVSGMLSTGGNLMPLATNAQDIGSSSLVWNNIYVNNVVGGSSGTQGFWQRNSNSLSPTNITDSVLVGGTATSSAKFQVYGLSALNPVASISGSSSKAAFIVDNTVGDLFTASSSGLNRFVITQNGNVGVGTSAPAYKLDVNGSTNIANGLTIAAGNLSFTGSQNIDATAILQIGTSNQTSITLGRSGAPTTINGSTVTIGGTQLTINNATDSGTLGVGGEASFSAKIVLDSQTAQINATNMRNLDLGFQNTGRVEFLNTGNYIDQNGNLYLAGSLVSSGTQAGFWQRPTSTGILAPTNITDSVLVGGTATSSAKFQIYGLSSLNPVASISASSSKAAFMVDNTVGDLFTASSSGLNRFVITQNGNVGIGSSAPGALLDVAGTARVTTLNATSVIQLNGASINTAGTLSNVAYLNQVNSFSANNLFTAGVNVASNSGSAPALTVNQNGAWDILTASQNGTPKFVINNAGNVGIGTAIPLQKLSVAGAVQLGASLGTNDLLNTAAAGGAPSGVLYWGSRSVCDSSGNCSGVGGVVGGSGTQNYVAKWNNAGGTNIGNSTIQDSGSLITLGSNATASGTLGVAGEASFSAKLVLGSVTPQINATSNRDLQLGFQNTGTIQFLNTGNYIGATTGYINSSQICTASGNCSGVGGIVGGTGTQNYITKWNNAGGTNIGNSLLYDNGSAVALGTTTPLADLDVRKQSGLISIASVSGATAKAAFVVDNSGTGDIFTASSSGLNRFVITQNGNVGIGTTVPSHKLHLVDSTGPEVFLTSGSVTTDVAAYSGDRSYVVGSGGDMNVGVTSVNNLYIMAGSSTVPRIFINGTSGNVGVGTTAPNSALQVHTSSAATVRGIQFTDGTSGSTATDGLYLYKADTQEGYLWNYENNGLHFGTNNTERLTILNTGNVGIGTTGPTALLQVYGASTTQVASVSASTGKAALLVDNTIGDLFTASSSGLSRFVITQNGNVGIGTTVPSVALDVVGAGKTSGAFTVGNALTISAGNISLTGSQTIDATGTLTIGGTNQTSLSLGRVGAQTTINGGPVVVNGASFASAGTTTFTGGNVGIGTSTVTDFKLELGGNIGPVTDNLYDLGSSSLRWRALYAYNINTPINQTGQEGFWQRASGVLAPNSITDSLLVGGTATSSAKFQVYGLSALNPVASISASSAQAAFMIDNTVGDLFTASSSGLNRFVITQNGNVGIGTTGPREKLEVQGTPTDDTNTLIGAWDTTAMASGVGGGIGFYGQYTSGGAYAGFGAIRGIKNNGTTGNFQGDLALYARPNVGNVTEYMRITSNGNVGIGTTTPTSPLVVKGTSGASNDPSGVGGVLRLSTGTGLGTDESLIFGVHDTDYSWIQATKPGTATRNLSLQQLGGNVGIGTTSPVGLLHVQGACVTGDTLIRRRRRRRRKDGSFEDVWEDIPVTDVKSGDEVMTLDEATGRFVVSTVKQLMHMGVKKTFELITSSGKSVRTTAKHPYLVLQEPEKDLNFLQKETFEFTEKTARDYYFKNFAGKKIYCSALGEDIHFTEEGWNHFTVKSRSLNELITRFFALPRSLVVICEAKKKLSHKKVRKSDMLVEYWELQEIVDHVLTKVVICSINEGPRFFLSSVWLGTKEAVGILPNKKELSLSRAVTPGRPRRMVTSQLFSKLTIPEDRKNVKWVKVADLVAGQKIATADGWETIVAIREGTEEQVYDLEIANTHNFVANGIVAHNTTGKALVALNQNGGDQAAFTASVSGTTKFVINNSGQVGIGTGANNNTLLADVDIRSLTSNAFTASVSASSGKATLTVDNTVGDLFTASSSGLSRFVITQNGNVGIGTTTPENVLDVSSSGTTGTLIRSLGTTLGTSVSSLAFLTREDGAGAWSRASIIGGSSGAGNQQGYLSFQTRPSSGGLAERVRIDSSGNVGIGTTGPGQKLHVSGGNIGLDNNQGIYFKDSGGTFMKTLSVDSSNNIFIGTYPSASNQGYVSIWFQNFEVARFNASSGNKQVELADGTVSTPAYSFISDTSTGIYRPGASTLAFSMGGSEKVRIDANGNMGIGTTSPLGTLDVRGNSGTLPVATISGQTSFAAMVVDNKGVGDIFTASSSGLNRFVITQNGNVGIGTTSPQSPLEVVSQSAVAGRGLITTQNSGDAASALIQFRKTRGTSTSPTTVSNNDFIGVFLGTPYDGASYLRTSALGFKVNGTVTTNNIPTDFFISTGATDDPNITNERLRITSAGNVGIGTTTVSNLFHIASAGTNSSVRIDSSSTANRGMFLTTTSDNAIVSNNAELVSNSWTARSTSASQIQLNGGNIDFLTNSGLTSGNTFTPSNRVRIDSSGNVGIGTTSPVGLLHVQGACVTADARIRRRKRKKNGQFSDEWEDVPIVDIKSGDQVMTLDEKTGEFVTSTVKQLMNMGTKKIFKLTTESGKTIRTTENHPYLVHGEVVDSWVKVKELSEGIEIATLGLRNKFVDRPAYLFVDETGMGSDPNQKYFGVGGLAIKDTISLNVKIHNVFEKLVSAYGGKEDRVEFKFNKITEDNKVFYHRVLDALFESPNWEFNGLVIKKGGKSWTPYSYWRRYLGNVIELANLFPNEKLNIVSDYLSKPNVSVKELSDILYKGNIDNVLQLESQGSLLLQVADLILGAITFKLRQKSKRGIAVKEAKSEIAQRVWERLVANKKDGYKVTLYRLDADAALSLRRDGSTITEKDSYVKWDKIVKIEELPKEQVYDIEVENTHNFVANGIVAHNTTGKALVALNQNGGDQAPFTASISGTTKFVINNSGQVGVGTGANNNTLLADVDIRALTSNAFTASISASSGKATLTVDNTVGDLFTASSSGLSRFVITQNGNVGIGTTVPGDVLHVVGSIRSQGFAANETILLQRANGTQAAPTTVLTTTALGTFDIAGYDGASYITSARIQGSAEGTVATNRVPSNLAFYTSTNAGPSVLTERLRIDSAGNVGIGTTNPASGKLQIITDSTHPVYVANSDNSANDLAQFWAQNLTTGVGIWYTGIRQTATNGNLTIDANGTGKILIGTNSTGNVGIGTTSPNYKLVVSGTGEIVNQTISTTTTTGDAILQAATGPTTIDTRAYGSTGIGTLMGIASANSTYILSQVTGGMAVGTYTNSPLTLSTNNTAAVTILSGGNVGIGTTSPNTRLGQKLEVANTANYGGMLLSTWSSVIGDHAPLLDLAKSKSNTIGTYTALSSGDTLGYISFRGADGSAFQTSAAIGGFADAAVSSGVVPGRLVFYTSNTSGSSTERVRIDSSGNVGIGTTSPVAILDLVGKQNFSAFTAPTALTAGTPTSGGSCTAGTHSYKVTFTSVGGGETTAGTVSNQITCVLTTGQTVPLTAVPTGPAGTISRKIYRTVAGDTGSYLLLTTISDNTTTTYSDTTADGSLGAAAPSSNTTAVANLGTGGTSRMFIDSNGYVGMGLGTGNAALADLDVRKISGAQAVASISGATAKAALLVDNSGTGDIFTASSSGLNRFVITQNGNVGIGTTTPGAPLLVNSSGVFNTTTGAGYALGINYDSATAGGPGIEFTRTGVNDWTAIQADLSGATRTLKFIQTSGGVASTQMVIDAGSGNVGIGIVTPRARLDVSVSSTSTSSAFIENSNTASAITGLTIKLGSTTNNSSSHYVNFLDLNGKLIGAIEGNTGANVAYALQGIADFGEWMKASTSSALPGPGTIVCQGSDGVVPCEASQSAHLVGVVSDTTGFLGGEQTPDSVIVGFVGQIRVKAKNVHSGDLVAVDPENPGSGITTTTRGYIVGVAAQDQRNDGTVLVKVHPGWSEGQESLAGSQKISVDAIQQQIASLSANLTNWTNLDVATVSGNLTVLGKTQLAQTTIGGGLTVGLLHLDDVKAEISGLTGQVTINSSLSVLGDASVSGQLRVKKGIVLTDTVTGEDYCVTLTGGEITKTKGECQ